MSYKNISKTQIESIYNESGITGRQASKKLGITYKTFKAKLKKFGIKTKVRTSKYPELNDKQWLKKEYINNEKSVRQIAIDINATIGAVYSAIKWARIEIRPSLESYKLKYPNGRNGKLAANWKGGKMFTGINGKYIKIYSPNHPNRTYDKYVMEHRLVMEKKIGRYLTKEEIVHHKDGNGHNNDINNLSLTTRKKHFTEHFDAVKQVKQLKEENKQLKKLLRENQIRFS